MYIATAKFKNDDLYIHMVFREKPTEDTVRDTLRAHMLDPTVFDIEIREVSEPAILFVDYKQITTEYLKRKDAIFSS